MRRLLLGLLTAMLTLTLVIGGSLILAKTEETPEAVQQIPTTVPVQPVTEAVETRAAESLPMETVLPETQPQEKRTIDAVPKYYQTDYPHIDFGNGTIATSGCSVTCLAMVATYLKDQEYTPVQMAYHFGNYGKNNIERLDHGLSQMQLPYQRVEDVQEVLKALRAGKVAILMMDEESVFTTEQHFVVAAGMTDDGKFIINDPYGTNVEHADVWMKNAYENGFEDYNLMRGFSGAWIFDKATMPEDVFLYDASLPEQRTNRYEGYLLTEEDIYTLACFVNAEAAQDPAEVQQAVAEVVLNRVMSPAYPNTVRDVIKKTELYRAAAAMSRMGEINLEFYLAVDAAVHGPYILPEDICFYSEWEQGVEHWGQLGRYNFYQKRG